MYLIQFYLPVNTQCTRFLDIHSVDTHKSIGYTLTSIRMNGVAKRLRHYVNTHTWLQSDTVGIYSRFYCNSK